MAKEAKEGDAPMKLFGNTPGRVFRRCGQVLSVARQAARLHRHLGGLGMVQALLALDLRRARTPGTKGRRPGQVFVANHSSMLDPALLMAIANSKGCVLRPLYKGEFNSSRFVTWFFSRVGAIPIKRGTADMKAIRRRSTPSSAARTSSSFPKAPACGTRTHAPSSMAALP